MPPDRGRRSAAAAQAQIAAQANRDIVELVGRGFQQMVATAISRAAFEAMSGIASYLMYAQSEFVHTKDGMASDAVTIGNEVKERAWEIVDSQRTRRVVDTRTAARLHGTLQRAIENMIMPTYDGVVVRIDVLDEEARHWRRINYGVGSEAASVEGSAVIANLAQEGPSPGPMLMPHGFWLEGGQSVGFLEGSKSGFFHPSRIHPALRALGGPSQAWYETKGIAGKHFLEKAFEVAEENFPKMVERRVKAWADQVARQSKGNFVRGSLR